MFKKFRQPPLKKDKQTPQTLIDPHFPTLQQRRYRYWKPYQGLNTKGIVREHGRDTPFAW